MENTLQKNIINMEQLNKSKESFVKTRKIIKRIFNNKENSNTTLIVLTILLVIICIYTSLQTYKTFTQITRETNTLENLNQYKINNLKTNPLTRNITATSSNIYELIDANRNIKDEIERYEKYKQNLQDPYTHFLQYLLLPKLNIRKNIYTEELYINILGKSFLEKNPYNDINLLQKWTDFFSNTNQNQINQIKDIRI
jgi:hypothetical protein